MRWSVTLGRVAGIAIRMHLTFLILLGWVGLQAYRSGGGLGDVLSGIGFVLAVFAVVVLHELGHALTARAFGVQTKDIVLLPIGGMARLESIPKEPRAELLIALAGPAVNAVLALGFGLASYMVLPPSAWSDPTGLAESFLVRMMVVNMVLGVFNLIPAFPMDGGRVLRAILAQTMPYARATRLAAGLGQGLALLFGLGGLYVGNPVLVFVALFVWMGAGAEANAAEVEHSLAGMKVEHAMITEFHVLDAHAPLSVAVQHVVDGFQPDFPVTDRGTVIGVLTRDAMISALSEKGPGSPVGAATRPLDEDNPPISPSQDLSEGLQTLQEKSLETALVMHGPQLVGLLTSQNVAEVVLVRQALARQHLPGHNADSARGPIAGPLHTQRT